MTFSHPNYLWLLLLLPFVWLYAVKIRPKNLPSFQFSSFDRLGHVGRQSNGYRPFAVLGALRIMGLAFIILGLARPQKGLKSEELTTKVTDIMICLDASRSMLSEDFKPDNRFAVSKSIIKDFIRGREHDRMGLILFAEQAITQCPLTNDENALITILESLNVGVIPPDQTAIGMGLATSVNRIKESEAKSKIIILVTDGSNNAGNVDPLTAAKTATAYGIKIYAIGAGSPEGGLMPIDDPIHGRRLIKTTNDLDEDLLLRIASQSGGKYFRAKTEGSLKTIFNEIDQLEKTDIKIQEFVDYEERYWIYLFLAFLLLVLEQLLSKTWLRTVP